jgi:hypothetical protein
MEPYPSGQFGFIDDLDRQFGNGSVWTQTRTRSDGPEPLLTLLSFSGVWEYPEVLRNTGKVTRSGWENYMWLPD